MATPPDFSPGQVLTAAHMDAVGLWKVADATWTSGAEIVVAGCFTSSYRNYRLVLTEFQSSASAVNVLLQLRDNSGNITTASYAWGYNYVGYTSGAGQARNAAATSIQTGLVATTTVGGSAVIDILEPQIAAVTSFLYQASWNATTGEATHGSGIQTDATARTGFRLFVTGQNLTAGRVRVYGYRD